MIIKAPLKHCTVSAGGMSSVLHIWPCIRYNDFREENNRKNPEKLRKCLLMCLVEMWKVIIIIAFHTNCKWKQLSWNRTKNLQAVRRLRRPVYYSWTCPSACQRSALTSLISTLLDMQKIALPPLFLLYLVIYFLWQFHKCNDPGDKRGVRQNVRMRAVSHQHLLLCWHYNDLHVVVPPSLNHQVFFFFIKTKAFCIVCFGNDAL